MSEVDRLPFTTRWTTSYPSEFFHILCSFFDTFLSSSHTLLLFIVPFTSAFESRIYYFSFLCAKLFVLLSLSFYLLQPSLLDESSNPGNVISPIFRRPIITVFFLILLLLRLSVLIFTVIFTDEIEPRRDNSTFLCFNVSLNIFSSSYYLNFSLACHKQ